MLLDVQGVSRRYRAPSGNAVQALRDVSLSVEAGQAVGLVGESGSGKSTLMRNILRLERPDSGRVIYDGIDILQAGDAQMRRFRREVQLVFQDPYSSLNPRMDVETLVGEGLIVHDIELNPARRRDRVVEILELVGLGSSDLKAYPRAFSGGQRQRIAIARAVAIGPRLLLCDEPVSALDVSVQAQIINLLQDMQARLGLTILFIAHDLAVVRHLCSQIHVMHNGEIVESGSRDAIFDAPAHAYTCDLLAAISIPDPVIARQRREARRVRLDNSATEGGAP